MSDLISRQAAIEAYGDWYVEEGSAEGFIGTVKQLLEGQPSAQLEPEDEEFEWCTDCKEYDQTAHCCHRFTKVIRQTVEELQAQPERTGEWNMCYDDDAPQDGIWFCSACGYARFVDDISPQYFCPQCGARMLNGR